ncbi:MAG: SET domain-containing protein-lysine N-methyltransferase [Chloroflexia bacterium]
MPRDVYPSRYWTDRRVMACPSSLGGTGGFATATIHAGESVQVIGGTILTTQQLLAAFEEYDAAGRYLNCVQIEDDLHLADLLGTLDVSFNHSCDPNLWMLDEITVAARRDIAPGEEMTIDYSLQSAQPNPLIETLCRCGSPLCRGIITGNDWRLPELQERYRGHFSPFINGRIGIGD